MIPTDSDPPLGAPGTAAPLDADAFLKAAEWIDDGYSRFACNALLAALHWRERTPEMRLFEETFKPDVDHKGYPVGSFSSWWGPKREGDDARVIALLLCYWMAVEDDGS